MRRHSGRLRSGNRLHRFSQYPSELEKPFRYKSPSRISPRGRPAVSPPAENGVTQIVAQRGPMQTGPNARRIVESPEQPNVVQLPRLDTFGPPPRAKRILRKLGLTPADAVNMLLAQIEIRQGLPFEVKVQGRPLLS